ncbi:hypothetical protein HK103_006779 [Boothiomyces macroporosus]|uniref:Uncharacterized protein n=1 Tax=Boothiomyces macroporosus TaxID=261099 RepID=A0AAD5UDA0_9FUNG|nr:hypothetical protein HK103_006779 [Boothiomyces macroporosus]
MQSGKQLAEKDGKILFVDCTVEEVEGSFEELLLWLKPYVQSNTNHHKIYYTLYHVLSHYYSNLAVPPLMCLLEHHDLECKQAGLNLLHLLFTPNCRIDLKLFIPVLKQLNAFYLKDSFDLLARIDKREFYTQISVFLGYYDKLEFLFQLVRDHKDVYHYHLYSDLYVDTIISQQPNEFYLDFLYDLYNTCPFVDQTMLLIYCANSFRLEKSVELVKLMKRNPSEQFVNDLQKLVEFDSNFQCFI